MSRALVFSPESVEQLAALYAYIAAASTQATAARYTEAIISYCKSLQAFPYRGTMRDDVRPGLRMKQYCVARPAILRHVMKWKGNESGTSVALDVSRFRCWQRVQSARSADRRRRSRLFARLLAKPSLCSQKSYRTDSVRLLRRCSGCVT